MNRVSLLLAAVLSAAPALFVPYAASAAATESAPQSSAVTMYVLPQCGYCEKAREYLRAQGVSWREADIATSVQAKTEFDAHGGKGTPLLLVGEQTIHGFSAAELGEALRNEGLVRK